MIGLFTTPQPKPVFTQAELVLLAEPIAAAFHKASPRERVFFALHNPEASYDTDRTSGSVFFRDTYMHIVLTDHYAFLPADTGGGERRDPRDTKGMKLWVAGPFRAASVPVEKEPRWTAFEKVHISIAPAEVLAVQVAPQAVPVPSRPQATAPALTQPPSNRDVTGTSATEPENDLHLEIRELTNANQDLRTQQKEQSGMIEKLRIELEQLRSGMQTGSSNPSTKQKPSPR